MGKYPVLIKQPSLLRLLHLQARHDFGPSAFEDELDNRGRSPTPRTGLTLSQIDNMVNCDEEEIYDDAYDESAEMDLGLGEFEDPYDAPADAKLIKERHQTKRSHSAPSSKPSLATFSLALQDQLMSVFALQRLCDVGATRD